MTTYPIHNAETAPEGSKPLVNAVTKKMGFVPNLIGVLAEAPAALET